LELDGTMASAFHSATELAGNTRVFRVQQWMGRFPISGYRTTLRA